MKTKDIVELIQKLHHQKVLLQGPMGERLRFHVFGELVADFENSSFDIVFDNFSYIVINIDDVCHITYNPNNKDDLLISLLKDNRLDTVETPKKAQAIIYLDHIQI
jgi:hypothetical protein